jgi:hypothetical protein
VINHVNDSEKTIYVEQLIINEDFYNRLTVLIPWDLIFKYVRGLTKLVI